jgi:hypothetical protein
MFACVVVGSRVRPVSGTGRARIALALAALALIAAGLAALLPAKELRATYSWPPRPLPAAHPAEAWYAPLLLARHEAGSIDAQIPCALPPPLPGAPRPAVVLATARKPQTAGGLAVTRAGGVMSITVGEVALARIRLPSFAPPPGCAYRLTITGDHWTITGGPGTPARSGETTPPIVSGLFSNLDLRQRPAPAVQVTTAVYGYQSTVPQAVLRILAVLFALTALVLVAAPSRPRWRPGVWRSLGLLDALVVVVLLVWWVLGPSFYDDGWIEATQRNFEPGNGFSSYYESFAVTSPLQYWLEWIEHPLYDATHSLALLRLPALVCLLATWFLCRWTFARVAPAASRAAGWALAAGFLTGAFAWGMTLRPEPVMALLVTAATACTVQFIDRGTGGPLAVIAVLAALALSAHPAGLATLAPLIVVAPAALRWARPRLAEAAALVLAAGSLLAVLALLGSDLRHLSDTVSSLRALGVEVSGWRDELTRYSLLGRDLYGAPLRRLWVVFALLAVFAYLLRARRDERPTLNMPAAAVGVGLLLLVVTPSKLPWHFGVMIGLAALALAAETARLATEPWRWHVRPFLVVAAGSVAAAWAWFPRNKWADLDLRTLDWTLGVERHITFAKLAGAVPVLVLIAFGLWELRRRRGRRLETVPWRAATWTVPAVAVPLIAFTLGVLAVDAHKTESWTLARQNLDTLRGDTGCGLADDSLVPSRESMRPLPALGRIPHTEAWLPQSPANAIPTFALAATNAERAARSPWFAVKQGRRTGFFLTGIPSATESVALDWGRAGGGGVTPLGSGDVGADLGSDARPELGYWRLNGATSLPAAPSGADALRFTVATAGAPAAGIGLTPPVSYEDETLTRLLAQQPALALPNLLTYFPFVRLPPVRRGVAEVPKAIVAFRDSTWPIGTGTSAFDEVSDLYPLVRLPLSDSAVPPDDVVVSVVDTHSPGAVLAPAVPST